MTGPGGGPPGPTDHAADAATSYEVRPPHRAGQPLPPAAGEPHALAPARPPRAVFVVHGMGQQIPFQTLDEVAEGLREYDALRRPANAPPPPKPSIAAEVIGKERVPRAELTLWTSAGGERKVHVYEGYWAPLTEGQVKLRDVLEFLLRGAWNGIVTQQSKRGFRRWLFNQYPRLDVPISASLMLGIAASFIVALVALNAAVLLVSAARSPLESPPPWLGAALFADLTTLMNLWVSLALAFGVLLLLAYARRRKPGFLGSFFGALSVAAFTMLVAGTILAGLSLPVLFWAHVRCAEPNTGNGVLQHALGTRFVNQFDDAFAIGSVVLLAVVAILFVLWGLVRLLAALPREIGAGGSRALAYALGMIGIAAVVVSLAGELRAAFTLCAAAAGHPVVRLGISWILLLVISAWVRSLLVQYPGDVAAYVTPQTLDRFHELRDEIKGTVGDRARAIYAEKKGEARLYERCVLVGHSLGSVVAYDVLNRLILEDETGPPEGRLEVVERTPLFLTFGSPLDKTAFVFGIQGNHTSEAREALAASVQPMICSYDFRPRRWVNLHSPWDIVSGRLDFYDPPGSKNRRRVKNYRDPLASTFLAAHVEYWKGELLFRFLHDELTRP